MTEPLLSIDNLSVRLPLHDNYIYPVSDLALSVKPGETVCLVGESGSGKSVSMQSILGLIDGAEFKKDASVRTDGESLLDISDMNMRKIRGRRIAMIFQEPMTALNPVMTVGEQMLEVLCLHAHHTPKTARLKAIDLLESVGIQDAHSRIDAYPHELSGGMKQRVVIAMALAGDPDILIADEPTTALDVTIQAQVLSVIVRAQQERNMGLILITHDLAIVSHIADTVAVMYAGEIVELASKEVFFKHPKHPYSQQLMACLPGLSSRHKPLVTIPGRLPTLIEHFHACRFAPRCPHVYARCKEQAPALTVDDQTQLRCHLYDDDTATKPHTVISDSADRVSQESNEIVLSVKNLSVYFRVKTPYLWKTPVYIKAVDGLSFDLFSGGTLAIVGESGCGKSTVAKSIMRLLTESRGEITMQGQNILSLKGKALKSLRRDVQMIYQDPFSSLNPRMTIRDILSEGWGAQGLYPEQREREQRLGDLLSQVGLPADILDRYPHEFSGGQRQRIAIARALAMDPKIIICDEPTSALDVSVQAQIINLLKSIQTGSSPRGPSLKVTYLIISHNLSVVAYMADYIAVMYLGRIVEYGPVYDIMTNPRHPYTQSLLASVPTIENRDRPFEMIAGELPSPSHPPSGCHFHPRCPHAMAVCKISYPPDYQPIPAVKVKCYLYEERDSYSGK